ncbi:MAG: helix-turn-helix domain-containing protein [Lachnospiraceae bacterium]
MDVGIRIKQLREEKGYSINKLANLAGVSQSYLRDIELSNKNPTVSFISLLCEQLGISLADFFNDSTMEEFKNEPLVQKIYKMTPAQKEALLAFLETME